jgi:hypothetical protein
MTVSFNIPATAPLGRYSVIVNYRGAPVSRMIDCFGVIEAGDTSAPGLM